MFKTQKEAHDYLRTLPKPKPYIHPTAIIEHTKLGKDVTVMPYAVIGIEGFGFDPQNPSQRWPHVGDVIIGDNVEIGASTVIERGTLISTKIGNSTKIDNLVLIGHNVEIGENVKIAGGVIIGGSCKIGNEVFVGLNTTIRNNITIGDNVEIGAGSVVVRDIPSNSGWWAGCPAKPLNKT